jgi:hypothetical protein
MDMATSTGNQLAQSISQRIEELKKVCGGLDEGIASRAPAGRWSPKEILSNFGDPKDLGIYRSLKLFSTRTPPRSTLRQKILFSRRSALE